MLSKKLALLTGAASGMGLQTAKLFAKNEATVIMVDINEQVKSFVYDLEKPKDASKSHTAFQCDVSKLDQIENLFDNIKNQYPETKIPNVIVNFAGIAGYKKFIDITEKEFYNVLNVNLKGTFFIAQKAAKELIANFENNNLPASATYASIINISSITAKTGFEATSHYSASKGAVESFTRCIAKELGNYKIRFNCVAPGVINTPMLHSFCNDAKIMNAFSSLTSLRRIGEPFEKANLCLFLASDNSSFITGASYDCNGGLFP